MKTLRDSLTEAAAAGLARLDAQLLLLHALGRPDLDRGWLIAHDTDARPADTRLAFLDLCGRRAAGEPLAYLVGHKEFFGLPLAVDERVLVPRPETEHLVEWSLEVLAGLEKPTVVDLGTGSGAIALALAHRRPDARIEAVDASAAALTVAAANAQTLALAVTFHQGDWLDGMPGPYDLIVSNPPYVAAADAHLAALGHEPLSALASGPDGLDALRVIAAQAPSRLRPGGWLLLEHGHDQAAAVRGLLAAAGLGDVQSHSDLAGIPRCSGGRRLELE